MQQAHLREWKKSSSLAGPPLLHLDILIYFYFESINLSKESWLSLSKIFFKRLYGLLIYLTTLTRFQDFNMLLNNSRGFHCYGIRIQLK